MINTAENGRPLRVAVLRGGPSGEYGVSLRSGERVLKNLPPKYKAQDVLISQDGDWNVGGVRMTPHKILKETDVVFNAMHGAYGEDGKVQQIIERFRVPYTGSGVPQSSLAMNKALSKAVFRNYGIKSPVAYILRHRDYTRGQVVELFKTFPQPSIVKPATGGSSLGVTVAHTFPEFSFAIENAFRHGGEALIEEYIPGREATVSVLESISDGSVYSLFPVEILREEGAKYFDFSSKYEVPVTKKCPGKFTKAIKKMLQSLAIRAHRALGLRHYSNSDFIIHPKRGIYLIEVNSQPGLTEHSILPASLEAADLKFPEFLDHLIQLALKRR